MFQGPGPLILVPPIADDCRNHRYDQDQHYQTEWPHDGLIPGFALLLTQGRLDASVLECIVRHQIGFGVMVPVMKQLMATIQGKKIQPDIQCINKLIADNPSWGRSRLSLELCRR